MYVKIDENNNVIKENVDVREEYPNMSFPAIITEDLLPHDIKKVVYGGIPAATINQSIIAKPITFIDGVFKVEYEVFDIPSEIILANKIQEAKDFLNKTDNREFPSYVPKEGEVLADTIAKRVEARAFIRANS